MTRRFAHLRPQPVGDRQARGLLDQLLVPALDRALPFAQVDDVPWASPSDLEFDVPRRLEELLEVDPGIAEGGSGLRLGRPEGLVELVDAPDDPHPLAATAGRSP